MATTVDTEVQELAPDEPEATKPVSETAPFKYAEYVHVGPGADECPDDGHGCVDPEHFHAWCRMPNQWQQDDIRQKAMAAKARRTRQLRDPESDSHAILESDLEDLERSAERNPEVRDEIVDEIVGRDWWKHQLEAMRDVEEREEFAHINQDRQRVGELVAVDEDKRPAEEWDELQRHVAKFGEAVEEHLRELEQPQRDALKDRTLGELVDIVRDDRVKAEASQAFMGAYTLWQVYVGTLRLPPAKDGKPHERMFASVADAESQDLPVVEALRATFTGLEAGARAGNA